MNILVVEDENLMREDIVRNLNQIGFSNVHSAINGVDAITMINMIPIDLILSDIKMPLMDGIELLRETKKACPDTIFIILSGYDLFEYARQALTLGAFGYLLKPIDVNELTDTIKKAEHYFESQNQGRKNTEELVRKISTAGKTIRNNYLCDLIHPGERTVGQITAQYPETGFLFQFEYYAIMLFDISLFSDIKDDEKIENILTSLIENLIKYHNCTAYCFTTENFIVFLYNFSDTSKFRELTDLIVSQMNEIDPLSRLQICLGEIVTNINLLERAFITAKKSILQPTVLNTNNFHIYQYINDANSHGLPIDFRFEKELLHLFEQAIPDKCLEYIISLYNQFTDFYKFDYENYKKLNLHILLSIHKIFTQLDLNPQTIFGDEFSLYKQINQLTTMEEVSKWYQTILTPGFLVLQKLINNDNTKLIVSAKKYIKEHLAEGLTLEGTASFVNLSTTYFSRFFKQETGNSFIDYVTELRIETAREMLTDSFDKVSDIAYKVGFNDIRYFYKVFKNHTGFTPTEYKRRNFHH